FHVTGVQTCALPISPSSPGMCRSISTRSGRSCSIAAITSLVTDATCACIPAPLSTLSANSAWLGSSSTISTRQGAASWPGRAGVDVEGGGGAATGSGAASTLGNAAGAASSHQRRQYPVGGNSARWRLLASDTAGTLPQSACAGNRARCAPRQPTERGACLGSHANHPFP